MGNGFNTNPYWQPNWLGGGGGSSPLGMSFGNSLGSAAGAGGGGWLSGLGSTLMGPAGLPIMMGANLLTGIIGGFLEGARKKKIKKAYEKQQGAYQTKANELFPELSQGSFQFQNPQIANAIQAALGSRMGNFANWGMPAGTPTGASSVNDFMAQLMPGATPPAQAQMAMASPRPRASGGRPDLGRMVQRGKRMA